jgi:hypothetical protein
LLKKGKIQIKPTMTSYSFPRITYMGKHDWQPIPLPAPEPPRMPPPEHDSKNKPDMGEAHDEKKESHQGSIVIGGEDPREDDKLWNPFKQEDDM